MPNKKKSGKIEPNGVDDRTKGKRVELFLSNQNSDKSHESFNRKRKLHKTYIKGWSEDILKNGYACCIIASCNFISSDITTLQKHHKSCNGVPLRGDNSCIKCGSFLSTSKELVHHKVVCKGVSKVVQKSSISSHNTLDGRSEGQEISISKDFSVGTNLSEMEDQSKPCVEVPNINLFCCIHCRCGFPTKEEHLKHQESCTSSSLGPTLKKAENLHFRTIKQMKKDSSDDHIIQPGPDLPKGQYRRRRAYRAEHKNSWAITLEKFKYVKCIYQNCYFIAMSLEDMISHFGYCNGDGSFAKFVCPYCNGRVTSEAILVKHIERSHPLETSSVKMEPAIKINEDDSVNSHLGPQNGGDAQIQECQSQEMNELLKPVLSTCERVWVEEMKDVGYGFCRKSLCNFMASSVRELEVHSKACDGVPNFELYNCQKCQHRLPSEEDLSRHMASCDCAKVKDFFDVANPRRKEVEEDDLEIGPVVRQYKSRRPKGNSKQRKPEGNSCENAITSGRTQGSVAVKPKTRGRPKKAKEAKETAESGEKEEETTCGKCFFRCTKTAFVQHNLKKHIGLGWMVGEEPVDLNDEKFVIRLVKDAFKYTKKAACEKCDVVKRSVMGFVSHIQVCGKSEEEKDALKVQCPHCEGKYLRYSLSSHIKLSHFGPEQEEEEEEKMEVSHGALDPSGKRRSALKAVTKFQQVLNDNEEGESNRETHYIFFERGSERIPKLNSKLNNLWYKLKRENKKIPCRHANCKNLSNDVREAKAHHYTCPSLPEKVFLCQLCDFYSVDEPAVKSHLTTHRKYLKVKKTGEEEVKLGEEAYENEEEENEEEEEMEEEEEEEEAKSSEEETGDLEEGKKRKRKKNGDTKMRKKMRFSMDVAKQDGDVEFRLKQNFCRREKIDNIRGLQFYSNGLDMTLQEELSMGENAETWEELHTSPEDWTPVPSCQAHRYLPELVKSVSVRFGEGKWRRFDRFESDLIGGVPVMFTGGSVRSISWCKVSFKRMLEKSQRQYIAVATSTQVDHLKDIHEKSTLEKRNLLQIWDCGPLENDLAKSPPKFVLGIAEDGREIWDLAWFPQDTFAEAAEQRLRRLGLLATACEDGAVRVWSVCDPENLNPGKGLPIYRTEPVVKLTVDPDGEESCLELSVGLDGVIAGGFGNGTVAVWNLRNVSSPFCLKEGRCKVIRAHLIFQAHKTAITALTFCPTNSRYISTAGLDRFVKMWDLEFPFVPVEQSNKEYSLDNIWTLNWPSLIYNFDDVVINFNKGAVKFIRDILTDRHQSTFAMEDTCLSLSFSDWLNALCGGSTTGEVKLRLLKNLIHDQKRSQSTITSVRVENLKERDVDGGRTFPRSYSEVESGFGLAFRDGLGMDKKKPEKPEAHPEEFPIRAVNKIAFNPNFKCFTHIALGYNCGLIRIQPLKELQSTRSLKFFLEKAEKKNF